MSKANRVKYAIKDEINRYLIVGENIFGTGGDTISPRHVFDSIADALSALQKRMNTTIGELFGSVDNLQIISVEVRDTPSRELVELTGVVDMTGLKFALMFKNTGAFLSDTRKQTTRLPNAALFATLEAACERMLWNPTNMKIVGIKLGEGVEYINSKIVS